MGWKRNAPNDYSKTVREGKKAAAERQVQELIDDVGLDEAMKLSGFRPMEVEERDRRLAVQAPAPTAQPSREAVRRATRALKKEGLLGKFYKGPRL